jgi:HK97 family phage major capsid protein/HK97 family phage prohead protease
MDRLTFAATGAVEGNTLSGVAHTFGTRTLRGNRYIEFARDAFHFSDVRAFLNHDTTLLLGRQSNGTVRLDQGPDGLNYAIELPETSYAADLKVLVNRGDLTEMSFGIMPGDYTTSKAPDGKPVITYTSAELFDISPVSLPAFGTGTSVQLHSRGDTVPEITDAMQEALDNEDTETFAKLEADLAKSKAITEARARLEEYRKPVMPAVIRATPKGDAGMDFAFDQYLRTGQPNHDLTFAQTVGSTTGGGYTVPDTFLAKLVERRVAFGGFMNEAWNITTATGAPLTFPVLTPPVYTEADIAAEGAASAAGADVVFPSEVTLGAYKYTSTGTGNVPLKVSVELLQDSEFDIGAMVSRILGERIARKQAYDLCNGSGSGAPKGIAYGTAGTVEADPTGFAAFSNLVHALDPAYRVGAKWIMNDTTAKTIEQLLDGASGTSGRPMLVNALQGIEGPSNNYFLLGYPVVIDQAMPTWAADDVIGVAFGNWKQAYVVRHVRDVQILVNPYGTVGYVQYDAWARMDGQVVDAYAYVTGEGV